MKDQPNARGSDRFNSSQLRHPCVAFAKQRDLQQLQFALLPRANRLICPMAGELETVLRGFAG
jgi:hypothetical protein